MKEKSRATRLIASFVCLALLSASFGPEAWAQAVPQVGAISAPVGGGSAAAGSNNGAAAPTNAYALTMPAASMSASPLAAPSAFLSAPAVAASLPAAAVNAAGPAAVMRAAAVPEMRPAPAVRTASESPAPALTARAAASTPENRDGAAKSGALSAQAPAAAPASAQSAEIETGPLTAGVGANVTRRFAELKSFFGSKKAESLPALAAASSSADRPHLAPASAPQDGSAKSAERMMKSYVGATNASQAGYEMMASASMPVYLEKTFGNMSWMADLSIAGTFASVIGRQLSPLIVNRFKLKSSYIGLLAATFMTALAIGGIANFGTMSIPVLFGLMITFRMLQAATSTAERTVIPSVYGKDQRAIESLRGRKQSWSEVASVLVQNGAAALVIVLASATPNLLIAPVFYLVAMGMIWLTLKIPAAADAARLAGQKDKAGAGAGVLGTIGATFKNFGRQIALGYKVVMHDPVLRTSAMVTALITLFNVLTYSLLAPLFAKFAIGVGADPAAAAPIMGLIAGLFSFGGLFAGKLVAKQAADLAAKHGSDEAAINEASRRSTIKWIKYAALSFLLVGAMALPLPILAPLISPVAISAAVAGFLHVSAAVVPTGLLLAGVLGLGTVTAMWRPKLGLAIAAAPILLVFPSHVIMAAIAFFAFGLLQVVASLKNDSFFDAAVQEKAPADYANAAAFVGAASMFAGMLGLTALKYLFYGKLPFGIPSPLPAFTGLPGIWPFVVIFAALALPTAYLFHRAAHRMDKLTTPAAKP